MRYEIVAGDETRIVDIEPLGEPKDGLSRFKVRLDGGEPRVVEACRPVPDVLSLLIAGRSWEAGLVPAEDGFVVEMLGVRHEVAALDPRRKALRMGGGRGSNAIVTQMPGRIVAVLVAEGDAVEKGQPVLIVEAMKMENQLKSPAAGHVRKIHVSKGDLVEAKATLVELDAP